MISKIKIKLPSRNCHQKQIKLLELHNLKNVKEFLLSSADVMDNISLRLNLVSSVAETIDEQKQCVRLSNIIMKSYNKVCSTLKLL